MFGTEGFNTVCMTLRNLKQNKTQTKKEVTKVKQSSWEKWQRRLSEPKQRVDLFRIAKQIKREIQDVIGRK